MSRRSTAIPSLPVSRRNTKKSRMNRVSCYRAYKHIVFGISAPSGCLQYYYNPSGVIRSFNYSPSPSGGLNAIGVEGSRQIASLRYGICIQAASSCSITYSVLSSDPNSFTMTGDVGAVDPVLLGTGILQDQNCARHFPQ